MSADALRQAVIQDVRHRDQFTVSDFDVSPGSNGSRTLIAEHQTDRPLAIRNSYPVDLALMAYEEFTTDGTAGNQETFSLSHDLVESGATSDDLILYEGGTLVEPDSGTVDYANDQFKYTDDGTANTLGVFYASGKQARVEVQKTAPNGTHEVLWTGDVSLLHMRDHDKDPVEFELDQSFFQSVIPTDWKLEIYVDAPYITRFEKDIDSAGSAESAINALLSVPYFGGTSKIDGLGKHVRADTARR